MGSSNRVLGGIGIVAGTTIGAGILVLPLISVGLGFLQNTILLTVMWLLMLFAALISLIINLRFTETFSIVGIAQKVLGKAAGVLTLTTTVVLFYSLLAAYTTGATEIIQHNIKLDIPHYLISTLIVMVLGLVVYTSISTLDYSNRTLLLLKILLFAIMVFAFCPEIKPEYIFSEPEVPLASEIKLLNLAIPVFFTSFGFHGSISVIIKYLDRDLKKILITFVLGSIIPLLIYILWQAMAMGILRLGGENSFEVVTDSGGDVGVFVQQLSLAIKKPWLGHVVTGFTWLAIVTSYLGVAAGLFDVLKELTSKTKAIFLTLLPPLFISISLPQLFIKALSFSSIALSIIAVIIPSAIGLKMLYSEKASNIKRYIISILLCLGLIFGVGVVIVELNNLW